MDGLSVFQAFFEDLNSGTPDKEWVSELKKLTQTAHPFPLKSLFN